MTRFPNLSATRIIRTYTREPKSGPTLCILRIDWCPEADGNLFASVRMDILAMIPPEKREEFEHRITEIICAAIPYPLTKNVSVPYAPGARSLSWTFSPGDDEFAFAQIVMPLCDLIMDNLRQQVREMF